MPVRTRWRGSWRVWRGDMVPEFDEAVFELEIDETSEVVETAFGYHLIHRTG